MIEVLKQMVEALEWCHGGEPIGTAEAIKAGKQAIAELESQESNPIKDGWKLSVANGHSGYGVYAHMNEYPEEGAVLLLPIKELESQEPVALPCCGYTDASAIKWNPLNGIVQCHNCGHTYAPSQRTWVGLTDDKHCDIWYKESLDWMEYGKAIESKLKELNT
jgi:hypothetical protein